LKKFARGKKKGTGGGLHPNTQAAPHFRRFSSFHIANSDKKSEIANKGFVLKRFLPTKQVSFRKRVLILFDWMKTRVFGRHTSIF
tara:strand:- start:402 stop:656 length:255 start_codon:yes stop_codon:yes gene_type:complete